MSFCVTFPLACRRFGAQYGSFVGPNTVQVAGVKYTADHILIAVGGRPTMPTVEGAEHCIDSNGFFLLEVRFVSFFMFSCKTCLSSAFNAA